MLLGMIASVTLVSCENDKELPTSFDLDYEVFFNKEMSINDCISVEKYFDSEWEYINVYAWDNKDWAPNDGKYNDRDYRVSDINEDGSYEVKKGPLPNLIMTKNPNPKDDSDILIIEEVFPNGYPEPDGYKIAFKYIECVEYYNWKGVRFGDNSYTSYHTFRFVKEDTIMVDGNGYQKYKRIK